MAFNFLVQGFCPLKIKITQFPDGFCLKILTCLRGCLDTFHIFLVFFVLKSLLGVARQSLAKFAILSVKPWSHVRILISNVGYHPD